jgi:hypothetical protein
MDEIKIGDRRVRVQRLSTREGMRVLADLTPLIGSAIAQAQLAGNTIEALDALFKSVSAKHVDWLVDIFARHSEAMLTDGGAWVSIDKGDLFEVVFAGDYIAVGEWLKLSLEVNFKRFLAQLGERVQLALAPNTKS